MTCTRTKSASPAPLSRNRQRSPLLQLIVPGTDASRGPKRKLGAEGTAGTGTERSQIHSIGPSSVCFGSPPARLLTRQKPSFLATAPCEAWTHHRAPECLPRNGFASLSPPAADHAALFLAIWCMGRKFLVKEIPSHPVSLLHCQWPSSLSRKCNGSFNSALPVRCRC